jgi:prepilin-type N-terminal cleavage/methylation domain-containing protein
MSASSIRATSPGVQFPGKHISARSSGFTLVELPVVSKRKRQAFTLVELLVVIAIIGILVALLLPAIQAAREAARRAQCQSNLHNVAIAVLNYESSKKTFPEGMTLTQTKVPTIRKLDEFQANWIIKTLPFMEEQPLYDSFDFTKKINDVVNSKNYVARGTVIPVLLCPSDGSNQTLYQGGASGAANHGTNWARANYAASAGRAFVHESTGFSGRTTGLGDLYWKDNCQRGVMGPNNAVKLRRVSDGTSKTIMLGEIRTGITENDARGVWAMGHAGASLLAKYGANSDTNGPNFCNPRGDDVYSDGCTKSQGFCAPTGENPAAEAECMGCFGGDVFDQAGTRSKHTGGVFMAMCDGSVQFIGDDIETSGCYGNCCTVWDWMILSADGGKGGQLQNVIDDGCQ